MNNKQLKLFMQAFNPATEREKALFEYMKQDLANGATLESQYSVLAQIGDAYVLDALYRECHEGTQYHIRKHIVNNPRCPEYLLEKALNDNDWEVRKAAVLREDTPVKACITAAKREANPMVIQTYQERLGDLFPERDSPSAQPVARAQTIHINTYQELKKRHQDEISAFPLVFAFSNDQLYKGMKEKWGLEPSDTDQICSVGAGGYARKIDVPALKDLLDRHKKELHDAIEADKTGEGFIFDMFSYELANHEYTYTYDLSDTLRAVGMTPEEINANPALCNGLNKAVKAAEGFVEEQETVSTSGGDKKPPLNEAIASAEAQKSNNPVVSNNREENIR